MGKFNNCSHVCVHSAQLSYTIQHKTVLMIFVPNFQTIIIAQIMSVGEERERDTATNQSKHNGFNGT